MSTDERTPTIALSAYTLRQWDVTIESIPLPSLLSNEALSADIAEIVCVEIEQNERVHGASTAVHLDEAKISSTMGVMAATAPTKRRERHGSSSCPLSTQG